MKAVTTTLPTKRCAIYTRKSHEEGLDQEFNSLDAQRESAEAFIASQRHEGWKALPDRYDDGGYTGSNTDRPALKRLMQDLEDGKVDVVLVYKVDRLSRSLLDFVTVLQVFDKHNVAFVSVTQQFNTATPMGRLVLNILICFAQFERENIAERFRDKMGASRRRGQWVGALPPLGYDVDFQAKKLIVNQKEAETVRWIFQRFITLGSAGPVVDELNKKGTSTKARKSRKGNVRGSRRWDKGNIYRILNNRTYIGEVEHNGQVYPGQHERILSADLWDGVHQILSENHRARGNRAKAKTPALLKGLVYCSHCASGMAVSFAKNHGALYRYYRCVRSQKQGADTCPVSAVPAGDLEKAVLDHLRKILRTPETLAVTSQSAAKQGKKDGVTILHRDVIDSLGVINDVWDELYPAEQCRILGLAVARVSVGLDGIDLHIHANGIQRLSGEIQGQMPIVTSDGQMIVYRLPLTARRRCGRTRVLAPVAVGQAMEQEDPLTLALAKAHAWLEQLESGDIASITELANRDGVDESYVRRHLQLTMLAPDVVESILTGTSTADFSVKTFTKAKISERWDEQKSRFITQTASP